MHIDLKGKIKTVIFAKDVLVYTENTKKCTPMFPAIKNIVQLTEYNTKYCLYFFYLLGKMKA